jgi:radical SAM-linked protein
MGYAVRVIFAKSGRIKYISHLDLMRLWVRALRRADVPFAVSEGFSKHPKFALKRALKLGVESDNEEAEFILRKVLALEELRQRLQKQLPEGIQIKDLRHKEK